MKPQDIVFIIVLLFLLWKRDSRLAAIFGLAPLAISIPLFATWTFFTAERLTWYAGAFFLLSLILSVRKTREK